LNDSRRPQQQGRFSPGRFLLAVLVSLLFASGLGFLSGKLGLSRPASMLVGGAAIVVIVTLLLLYAAKNTSRRK
jgi:protein-S-isoprenylcysteine O-methyltransferase Ste14